MPMSSLSDPIGMLQPALPWLLHATVLRSRLGHPWSWGGLSNSRSFLSSWVMFPSRNVSLPSSALQTAVWMQCWLYSAKTPTAAVCAWSTQLGTSRLPTSQCYFDYQEPSSAGDASQAAIGAWWLTDLGVWVLRFFSPRGGLALSSVLFPTFSCFCPNAKNFLS